MKFSDLISRIRWATAKRKDRINREKAYNSRFRLISSVTHQMWGIVYPKDPPLVWKGNFFKYDASFGFKAVSGDDESNGYYLGLDQDNNFDFAVGSIDRKISYWSCMHVLAAGIIAEIKSRSMTPPKELVETILAQYFSQEGLDAAGRAEVWMLRLNSTVLYLWGMADVFALAITIAEEEGLDELTACIKAKDIMPTLELPMCFNDSDGVGRHIMSYSANGSCFYTINFLGQAVCNEYPNEHLDLADYETMLRVACTIVRDMRQGNDTGLWDATKMIEDEPEWDGNYAMPKDRGINDLKMLGLRNN